MTFNFQCSELYSFISTKFLEFLDFSDDSPVVKQLQSEIRRAKVSGQFIVAVEAWKSQED